MRRKEEMTTSTEQQMSYYYDALTASHHSRSKSQRNATLERQYQRQLRRRLRRGSSDCFSQPLPRSMVVCVAGLIVVACGVLVLGAAQHNMQRVSSSSSSSTAATTTATSKPSSVSPGAVMEQYAAAIAATSIGNMLPGEEEEQQLDATERTKRTSFSPKQQQFARNSTESSTTSIPSWLSDYLDFHSDHSADAPVLQWTCVGGGCGGLGDRMLGIVQTFLIAVSNRRVFVVDDAQQTPVLVADRWRKRGLIPDPLQVIIDDRSNPFWKDPTLDATQPFLALKTNLWTGEQFWSSPCWQRLMGSATESDQDAVLRMVLHHLFDWPAATVASGQQWLASSSTPRPFIGVHIRTGRLDASTHLFHPQVPAMLDCARHLTTQCNSAKTPHHSIYVATDDAKLRSELATTAQDITTMESLQVEHSFSSTTTSASDPALVELWLLSTQSACVVTTPQSKFSYVAGLWAGCRVEVTSSGDNTCVLQQEQVCRR